MVLLLAGILGSEKIGEDNPPKLRSSADPVGIPEEADRRFRNVTGNSARGRKIGHVAPESPVTFGWNARSRSPGTGGHVGPEYALHL
jgi:hypothetical protein